MGGRYDVDLPIKASQQDQFDSRKDNFDHLYEEQTDFSSMGELLSDAYMV